MIYIGLLATTYGLLELPLCMCYRDGLYTAKELLSSEEGLCSMELVKS
jgi:hypothetical protein